jgi:hypothetical protein
VAPYPLYIIRRKDLTFEIIGVRVGGMSFTITTDVFCDKCGDWTSGISGPVNGKREAWEIAKSRGWSMVNRQHLCPICNGRAINKGKYGYTFKKED